MTDDAHADPGKPDAAKAGDEAAPRTRQPLLLVLLALLIIQVRIEFRGVDLLPDPLGWLLVAVASAALPHDVPRRPAVVAGALLAAAASVATWPTSWKEQVDELEPALLWAITLPSLAWSILFCLAVAHVVHERAPKEVGSMLMWKYLGGGFIAATVLPVLVFGAGLDALEDIYAAITVLVQLGLFALCLFHAWKPWALVPPAPTSP